MPSSATRRSRCDHVLERDMGGKQFGSLAEVGARSARNDSAEVGRVQGDHLAVRAGGPAPASWASEFEDCRAVRVGGPTRARTSATIVPSWSAVSKGG